jgi:hypothetical protein
MHPNDIPIVAVKWLAFLASCSDVSGGQWFKYCFATGILKGILWYSAVTPGKFLLS